ncbi:hypothetical protein [Leuconostoc mesenteroides]|uniref:hypothetical protein n=1 Tax=Leuconostoc mesenteroides TaxID=1245 RepID=UPI0022E67736|nr:hypothetical protein [Leuconostoc mesenteroides]
MFDKFWQNALFTIICGAFGGLIVLGGNVLLSGVHMELGSWASWFSGILTSLGLIATWISSYLKSRVQLNIKLRTDNFYVGGKKEPIHINYFIEIFNSGHVPVRVSEVGLYIKKINNKRIKDKKFIPFYTNYNDFKNGGKTLQPQEELKKRTNNSLLEDSFSDNAEISENSGTLTVVTYIQDKSNNIYYGKEHSEIDMQELSSFGEITAELIRLGKIKYDNIKPK